MKRTIMFAAMGAAALAAQAAGPFDQFKGKMKPGLYETKMEMQIPGMPAGMGPQKMTFHNCVTPADIDKGHMGSKDGNMPKDCEIRNFKMSGDTASYTMVCKGEMKMNADTVITFRPDGYDMQMKMAMDQGGKVVNMSQKMQARYLGACKQ
jgi:hypothetical protein